MKAHTRLSTYTAFAVWGAAAFMAQPSIASLAVHFVVLPLLIVATIWLAHREGGKNG